MRKPWLSLCLAAGAVPAIGCGPDVELTVGKAPPREVAYVVSAQSGECPASQGSCVVASGSVFCGPGRPRASAFQTSDGGWCAHTSVCGADRPLCTLSNTEN